jgi:hypothetical protein
MATTLELEVPDTVIRKLKALSALEGFTTYTQMVDKAAHMFEEALVREIASHLNPTSEGVHMPASRKEPEATKVRKKPFEEAHFSHDGLSDSLGDEVDYEAEEPAPETDAFAMVPKFGGLSDKELEQDMAVEDPAHEAKAEPPPGPVSMDSSAEDLFAAISGIPLTTEEDEEIDHRILKRKKRVKHKATVSSFDGHITESF